MNGAVSPYSSPWKSIGVNGARQTSSAARGARVDGRPVAERAVADLVGIGGEDDEALRRHAVGGGAGAAPPARRVRAVVHVGTVEGLRERGEVLELLVPAARLTRQGDAQGVVEVVRPRGVARPPA